MDVGECMESIGRDNCFGVVTPQRTYYFLADTLQGCKDWIKALKVGRYDEMIMMMLLLLLLLLVVVVVLLFLFL